MNIRSKKNQTYISQVIVFLSIATACPSKAQIVPDKTLPFPTRIDIINNITNISSGTKVGNNLFHSFEEFSVLGGSNAIFNQDSRINNVIARVTGLKPSSIDGTITSTGAANLFLINPNGIVFNSGANLNIGGAFVGTTANSISFSDGNSMEVNQNIPLNSILSVGIPIGLNFEGSSARITVNGQGHSLTTNNSIYTPVQQNTKLPKFIPNSSSSVSLIGGDIILNGGLIYPKTGPINIGAIDKGTVSFLADGKGIDLSYKSTDSFKDISLINKSAINVSSNGTNSINLNGNNISILNGSVILSQNQGRIDLGNININSSNTINISGLSQDLSLPSSVISETVGSARNGDVNLRAKDISVSQGGFITSRTFTKAVGGNILINTDLLDVKGVNSRSPLNASAILSLSAGTGSGGNIQINSISLSAEDGANIGAAALSKGNGGDLLINANEISLSGISPLTLRTSIFANTVNDGNAGNVLVNSNNLNVKNGAVVSSSTAAAGNAGSVTINNQGSVIVDGEYISSANPNLTLIFSTIFSSAVAETQFYRNFFNLPDAASGNAGNVTIKTGKLFALNGGRIASSSNGVGASGNLVVNASDSVSVSGTDRTGRATVLSAQSFDTGKGGSVSISSPKISVSNGGAITAASNTNSGGEVRLSSSRLALSNGRISAINFSGSGGDIFIDSKLVTLANKSIIVGNGKLNGGNININSSLIAGDSTSFISANSLEKTGGNININTDGLIFPLANVTATSAAGNKFEGSITVNFSTKNFLAKSSSNRSLILTSEPVTCKKGYSNLQNITAEALNMPDERLESYAKKANIPMFVDSKGKKILLIEIQGWIPAQNGHAKTVAIVNQAASSEELTVNCKGQIIR